MTPVDIFNQRRDQFCKPCAFWRGVCLKGHALSSPEGCPIKKFEPIDGADYAPDNAVTGSALKGCTNCDQPDMPAVTWGQVMKNLAASMVEWVKAGMPLADAKLHGERYQQGCKRCPHYRNFYCTKCKCLAYVKAKLRTSVCPDSPPRW